MRMCNKALLALACTAALSACDGEKVANSIAKRQPLILPEVGLYQADLLSRESDKATHKMIPGMNGLALVYPKTATDQRWGVWVDYEQDTVVETNSQWVGNATQKEDKDGKFPYTLERTSERLTPAGRFGQTPSKDGSKAIIAFKDTKVIDTKGKEQSLWAFDFSGTGTQFSDSSVLYPNWVGHIALSKLVTKTIPTASWSEGDDMGFTDAFIGQIATTNNGGKVTLEIELPGAGCKIYGQGTQDKGQNNGLSELTVAGFEKCKFVGSKDYSPLENKWILSLGKVTQATTAYATVFNNPETKKDELVIGFPYVSSAESSSGLVLMAEIN
ncbi:hypothetical protein [Aeromonas jandaei]|uniref:hypothetical protein n=1 Tax=Aeromonas jandaei TaxID=650 RepID=UPI001BB6A6C5|nr:hypothetical protein [Aeromonas jandaei]QTL96249.1 hypothetical protein AjGTCBM29_04183 [Aeromonas jandaei]